MLKPHTHDGQKLDSEPSTTSRRTAIRWLAAAATVPVMGASSLTRLFAEDEKPADETASHQLYIVVAKEGSKFDDERREELDVLGPGSGTYVGLDVEFGYLAWITAEVADKIAKEADIRSIEPTTAKKAAEVGAIKDDEEVVLIVQPAPNNWKKKPLASTFVSNEKLAAEWSKKFRDIRGVKVTADANLDVAIACRTGRCQAVLTEPAELPITIRLPNKKELKQVLEILDKHPQNYETKIFGAAELKRLREQPPIDGCPGCGLG